MPALSVFRRPVPFSTSGMITRDAVIKMAPCDMIFGFAKRDVKCWTGEMLLVGWQVHRCFWRSFGDWWSVAPAKQNPATQRKIPSFKQLTEFPHEIKLKVMSNTIKVGWFPDPDWCVFHAHKALAFRDSLERSQCFTSSSSCLRWCRLLVELSKGWRGDVELMWN